MLRGLPCETRRGRVGEPRAGACVAEVSVEVKDARVSSPPADGNGDKVSGCCIAMCLDST